MYKEIYLDVCPQPFIFHPNVPAANPQAVSLNAPEHSTEHRA
jgi:hypothetical protein